MRAVLLATALVVVCPKSAAVGNAAGSPNPEAYGPAVQEAYDQIRAATRAFHRLEAAVEHGYAARVADCLEQRGPAGWGFII